MYSIIKTKHTLMLMEKNNTRNQIIDYLYKEWYANKGTASLCTLLIQQLISYLLLMDMQVDPSSNPDCSDRSRDKFQSILDEAILYGKTHYLDSKYFLWQICYYLSGISTYYYLYGCLLKINEDADDVLNLYLTVAENAFPDSLLFYQFREYLRGNSNWQLTMTESEKARLMSEVKSLQLQDNLEDKVVQDYFASLLQS